MILKLYCHDCDSVDCEKCPIGTYTTGKYCYREVSEEDYIKYFHYMKEVLPFMHKFTLVNQNDLREEILQFLEHIYRDTNICGSQIQLPPEPEEQQNPDELEPLP